MFRYQLQGKPAAIPLLGLWCVSVLTLISVSCQQDPVEQTMNPPQTESSDAGEKPLCLVVSGDTQGWLIPCGCTANQSGGLLRRASYVSKLTQSEDAVILDVGGAVDGVSPYQQERFRAILRGEVAMGLKAHNLGGNEIALGIPSLRELAADTGVQFISANAYDQQDQRLFESHLLLSHGARNILIIGVLSPSFTTEEIIVRDPLDSILQVLSSVEEADMIAVLAYLPPDELRDLANAIPEADTVIGGPTGQTLKPEMLGNVLLTSATNKGKFLVKVNVTPDRQNPPTAEIIELSPEYEDHPNQTSNLEQFRQFLAERDFSALESGFLNADTVTLQQSDQISGTESCQECHEETNEHWHETGHAHAWKRLVDLGAHVDPYCQQCHTTGYGLTNGFYSRLKSDNRVDVGCESCHGPSQKHALDPQVATTFGAAGKCLDCHDKENSPEFEYDHYWEKIFHE